MKIFSGGKKAEEKLAICAKENRPVSKDSGVLIYGLDLHERKQIVRDDAVPKRFSMSLDFGKCIA